MRVAEHDIPPDKPVLIAGTTASGKSALAMEIAAREGGVIINADAIQVYANWRVLTARPSAADEARLPHRLFGHIAADQPYSVGAWLREVAPLLEGPARPIIVGGTGLYFTALTEGLAEIPPTPDDLRAAADALRKAGGMEELIAALDPDTQARIDLRNPMRVQRAWEVQRNTGRGLATWQDITPAPLLPRGKAIPLLLDAPKDWLTPRIEARFTQMLKNGALEEARANLSVWQAGMPSAKAIGAKELISHLEGKMTLEEARDNATIATRQFAKRQRTWFRARMRDWLTVHPDRPI